MKKLKLILPLLLLSGMVELLQAQTPQLSQFMNQPLYLNPAYAGATRAHRFMVHHRAQYLGQTAGNFNTSIFSYDAFFTKSFGVGALITQDAQSLSGDQIWGGELTTRTASLLIAYEQVLNRNNVRLRGGIQLGAGQRGLNEDGLIFGNGLTPTTGGQGFDPLTNSLQGSLYYDVSVGVLLSGQTFTIGGAIHHLPRPQAYSLINDPSARLPIRYTLHAGKDFYLPYDPGRFQVAAEYRAQGRFDQFSVGLNKFFEMPGLGGWGRESYHQLYLGAWFRGLYVKQVGQRINNSDAMIITGGYVLGTKLATTTIGLSYDVTTSQLSYGNTYGSFEVSLSIAFKNKPRAGSGKRFKEDEPVRLFDRQPDCDDYLLWKRRKLNHAMLMPIRDKDPGKKLKGSRKKGTNKRFNKNVKMRN